MDVLKVPSIATFFRARAVFLLSIGLWELSRAGDGTARLQVDSMVVDLSELKVEGKKAETVSTEVRTDFIPEIPGAMNDPVRAVSFLPGVTVQNDLNARPFVRGGDADQTQTVINGIPLLQPYHVGGAFSTFDLNTLDAVDLYEEDFPVENPGALSGVLGLKIKKPSETQAHVNTDLSLMRGDAYAEVPVIKNRLSVYGGAQYFLFDQSLHGLLDLASLFSGDSVYREDIRSYGDHINLPEFQDYHWGASFLVSENMQINYLGSFSRDDYAVVVPSQTDSILNSNPGPIPNPIPTVPTKEIARSNKLSVDSISSVDILNQTHFVNIPWDVNSRTLLENNFGYQSQKWNVAFKKAAAGADTLALSQSTQFFNYQLSDTYKPSENQQFKFGMSYDYQRQTYDAEMPYVLYDLIVNSNLDVLDALGYFSDNGFEIEKTDSSRSNADYLGEYPLRIRFSHQGVLEEHFASLFYSHTLNFSTGTFSYGIRGEYQSTSKEFFPAPRLGYRWKPDRKNEILFSAGLYSQNNLPFYERDENRGLKSEKSAQAGVQWSRLFGKGYRLSIQNYFKYYYDLVVPELAPDGKIDLTGLLLPLPSSPLSADEIARLKNILDTTTDFPALPDSIKQLSYQTFGDLVFKYANTGVGYAYGSTVSLFYNPNPSWNGWMSMDASVSERRDGPGQPWYEYRYHRPLVFNWVNYFKMPSDYDISFTYRWAMGQPYTPYSGTLDDAGSSASITVGARDSGRLSPYNRLDLRLSRHFHWWNTRSTTYMEVWNAMNEPNYFERDATTGELKSAQLNWPFPVFFLGMSWEM